MDNAQVLFCRGYGPAQPIFVIASPKVLKLHQNHIFFFLFWSRCFACTHSDEQAPILVYCPEPIYESIARNEEALTWREPEFIDNVKVVKVESSKKSGDTFQIGSTNVEYTAFDDAGNLVRCSFVVNLKRKSFYAKDLFTLVCINVVC